MLIGTSCLSPRSVVSYTLSVTRVSIRRQLEIQHQQAGVVILGSDMDPQVHLGIKGLWGIPCVAAYLQGILPSWVTSRTIRKRVPPGRENWALPSPRALDLIAVRDLPEPFSKATPDIIVEMTKHRFRIEIGSAMDGLYSVGLGTAIMYTATEGILLYWVEKEPYVV